MKNFDNNNEFCFLLVVQFIVGYLSVLAIVRAPPYDNEVNPGFPIPVKPTLRKRERTALFGGGGGGGESWGIEFNTAVF